MGRWGTLIFAVLLVNSRTCEGITKQWLPNTNFGNDANWDTGHVPCGAVSVHIPEVTPQIYVQLDTTIKELLLPNNVELILGDGLNLVFSDNTANPGNCQNATTGDVNYKSPSPSPWFDPDNWCTVPDGGGKCTSTALLDTEQIPCTTDDVVFSPTDSYYVNLDTGYNISVGSLTLSRTSYTTESFRSFLSTDAGKRTFPQPAANQQSVVTVDGKCTDVTGCVCRNDDKINEKICKFFSKKCDDPSCAKPLRALGSCCYMCGAILQIEYGKGFKFPFFRDSVKTDFLKGKSNADSVNYIVSKTDDGKVQMVLSDEGGNNSIPFAKAIKKALQKDVNDGGVKYGITKVSLTVSEGAFQPSPSPHKGGSLDGGQIAGIVVGLIVFATIVLVAAYFVYRKRTGAAALNIRGFGGFGTFGTIRDRFRKFRSPRQEFGASIRFTDPQNINATLTGIDNPLYGTRGSARDVEMPQMSTYDQDLQPADDHAFDNPMYGQENESAFYANPAIRKNPAFDPMDADNCP